MSDVFQYTIFAVTLYQLGIQSWDHSIIGCVQAAIWLLSEPNTISNPMYVANIVELS